MTWNLLLWKWSVDFDTSAKRKKAGLKFADVMASFAIDGKHPAIGEADIQGFRAAIDQTFGVDEDNRPFVFEDYGDCAVINYPNDVRFDLAPKLAAIGRKFALNASEF